MQGDGAALIPQLSLILDPDIVGCERIFCVAFG